MWQRLVSPDILIFLDVSFEESLRRKKLNWQMEDYLEQHRRLAHARQHANFYLDTTLLAPENVLTRVIEFLKTQEFDHLA
jgi:thymidylate kinase